MIVVLNPIYKIITEILCMGEIGSHLTSHCFCGMFQSHLKSYNDHQRQTTKDQNDGPLEITSAEASVIWK